MSLRNALAALALTAPLAACGFEPIAVSSQQIGEQDLALSGIVVNSTDSRFSYQLRKELLRFVELQPDAPQSLTVTSSIATVGLAIQQNDTITRQNVTVDTNYSLAEKPAGPDLPPPEPITGSTRTITAVNTTSSQFSATVSTRDAIERLASETARRLVTFLRVNRPDPNAGDGS